MNYVTLKNCIKKCSYFYDNNKGLVEIWETSALRGNNGNYNKNVYLYLMFFFGK